MVSLPSAKASLIAIFIPMFCIMVRMALRAFRSASAAASASNFSRVIGGNPTFFLKALVAANFLSASVPSLD